MNAESWKISEGQATLKSATLSASADVRQPARGLQHVVWNQTEIDGELLGLELPDPSPQGTEPSDAYARIDDLVVTFSESPQWQLRTQFYWRYCRKLESIAPAVELIASLQTNLLDAPADVSTRTHLSADETFYLASDQHSFRELARSSRPQLITSELSAGCILFRLTSANVSYAEIVHPSDFRETTLEALPELRVEDPATSCRHRLFGRRLEKGVILRARVLAVLLPQDDDLRIARHLYRLFAASEPVLTA
jgi:hypothetical protein